MRSLVLALAASASCAAYDPVVALKRVHQSGAAYCPPAAVQTWTCPPCLASSPLSHVISLSNSSTQLLGFVGLDASATPPEVVVAFRGSETLDNWLEDFDIELVPYSGCAGCLVHKGWLEGYASVAAQLFVAVRATLARAPGAVVALSGHSLGAALSEIAAFELARAGLPVGSLVTFGAPRAGNDAWAAAWTAAAVPRGAAFRVVHHLDPVPRLVPRFIGNYTHPPREVWYDSENGTAFVECDATDGEDPTCSDSDLPLDAKDHDTYLGVLLGEVAC
jgi:hypothetical protein